jgi:hypothetical protein
MPEGTEIIIAIEKPKAITTNNARIFLLETFLTALVKAPKCHTFLESPKKREGNQGGTGFTVEFLSTASGTASLFPSFITDFPFWLS